MPLLHNEQRTDAWLAARQGKITASLAAACLGLDPYQSRQAAWRAITGNKTVAEQQPNEFMRWGNEAEATARLAYETESGLFVTETGFWVDRGLPWLGASPDGLIGDDGLLEIKCPHTVPTQVPIHHRIQMIVQMCVTDRIWCDYFAWTPEGTFCRRVYPVGIGGLLRRLAAFYDQFVVTKTEPPRKRRKKAS